MPEWSNGPDSKSGERLVRSVGLNPTLSAVILLFVRLPHKWLYDCRTQEVCRYLLKNKDDASKRVEGIMFFCYPEDCGLAVLKSEDLMDAYEAGQLSGELKEIAAGLKADDNPVLMLIHFKK